MPCRRRMVRALPCPRWPAPARSPQMPRLWHAPVRGDGRRYADVAMRLNPLLSSPPSLHTSPKPVPRLSRPTAERKAEADYHSFFAQLNIDASIQGTTGEPGAASQLPAGSPQRIGDFTSRMPIQTSPETPRLRPSLSETPITCDLIASHGGSHATVPEVHSGAGFIQNVAVPNCGVYTGQFEDGTRHGRGITQYPNGATHEGHYFRGLKHGAGPEVRITKGLLSLHIATGWGVMVGVNA